MQRNYAGLCILSTGSCENFLIRKILGRSGLNFKCILTVLFQQFSHISYEVGFIFIVSMIAATNLYLYCFFGIKATMSFVQMADTLFECNWQVLPVHFQKYWILMIKNAQKPIFYHGFGMAVLNLETFSKVSTFQMKIKFFYYFSVFSSSKQSSHITWCSRH